MIKDFFAEQKATLIIIAISILSYPFLSFKPSASLVNVAGEYSWIASQVLGIFIIFLMLKIIQILFRIISDLKEAP